MEEEESSFCGEHNCPPSVLKPFLAKLEAAHTQMLALRQPGDTCPCAAARLAVAPTLLGHPQTVPSALCLRWVREASLRGAFVQPRTSDPNSSATQEVG